MTEKTVIYKDFHYIVLPFIMQALVGCSGIIMFTKFCHVTLHA